MLNDFLRCKLLFVLPISSINMIPINTKLISKIKSNEKRIKRNVLNTLTPLSQIDTIFPMLAKFLNEYSSIPLESINFDENIFQKLHLQYLTVCQERNKLGTIITCNNYVDYIASLDKIPKTLIHKLSQIDLPKTINIHQHSSLCELTDINQESLIETVFIQNKYLNDNRPLINIIEGNKNYTKVNYDDLSITITYKKSCIIHQIIYIIHELGHANNIIGCLLKNKNPRKISNYENEKIAIAFQIDTLKKLQPTIYKQLIIDLQNVLKLTLFEINLYQSLPKEPLIIFSDGKLKSPYLYLTIPDLIYQPLKNLVYASAFYSLSTKQK